MRPRGFPPALRLHHQREFDLVFKEGARASDGLMAVHARRNGGPEPRLGLAVGKAVGGAVARNRVKRLLREAFRLRRGDLPAGHDLVVVPRPDAADSWTLATCEKSLVAVAGKAAERLARDGARRGQRTAGGGKSDSVEGAGGGIGDSRGGEAGRGAVTAAFDRALGLLLLWGVAFYRAVLSPLLGGACRFTPSCSEYARQALRRHGGWRGLRLTLARIGRCRPGVPGGEDPIPE